MKKQLTIEEKLQNALVPKKEQPYKIPSNWCWSYWKYIAEIFSAKRIHKSDWKKEGIPFYRAREIVKLSQDGYVNNEIFISNEKYLEIKRISRLPKAGDLMVSGVGTIGASYVVNKNDKFYYKDASVLCVSGYNKINAKYLNFYLKSPYMINEMKKGSKGTTVDTLTINKFNNYLIVLPPINEQQRIVNRIESLFTKLDKAKELIENTLVQFEQNKMAILHKAFTGELTAKWRKENNIDLSSWQTSIIKDIGDVKGGKRLPKGESLIDENTGYPYIKAGNLKNGTVLYKELQYLEPQVYEKIKNYTVKTNDVYITIVGACIGDVGIIPKEVNGANLTENAAKITNLKCNAKFLSIQLSTTEVQKQIKNKIASATLGKLSLQNIKSLEIKLPTIKEQQEIVKIMDEIFAKYDKTKTLQNQLDKIELLKKSILAKAFRGELGTNDPNEESAEVLLRKILAEK